MTLLNAAFQNSIKADTYFVGIREGNEMRFELLYDDGEFYENQRVKLEGSLSEWVLNNQQSLFLPDLRKEITLPTYEAKACRETENQPILDGGADAKSKRGWSHCHRLLPPECL